MLKKVIANHAPLVGKPLLLSGTPNNVNWWFTTIHSRAIVMTTLHTGDSTCLELAKTFAVGKENRAQSVSTLFAVLYHLTGEKRYRDAVLGPDGSRHETLGVGGYLYVCDHWLLNQPPRTKPLADQ